MTDRLKFAGKSRFNEERSLRTPSAFLETNVGVLPSDQSLFVVIPLHFSFFFLDHRNFFFFPLKTTQSNCPLPFHDDGRPHALLLAPAAAVVTGGVVKGVEKRGRWRGSPYLRRSRQSNISLLEKSSADIFKTSVLDQRHRFQFRGQDSSEWPKVNFLVLKLCRFKQKFPIFKKPAELEKWANWPAQAGSKDWAAK